MGASAAIRGRRERGTRVPRRQPRARAAGAPRPPAALAIAFGGARGRRHRDRRVALVAIDAAARRGPPAQHRASRASWRRSRARRSPSIPELGVRLALWALDTSPTGQAGAALREATLGVPPARRAAGRLARRDAAAYSPDGKRVVTGGTDGARDRLGRRRGARSAAWTRATAPCSPRATRRRRARSRSASRTALCVVTDGSLAAPRECRTSRTGCHDVAFSGDGERVAAALDDGTVRVIAADGRAGAVQPERPRRPGARRRHQRGRQPRRECRRGRERPALERCRRRTPGGSCTAAASRSATSHSARTGRGSWASATTAGSGSGSARRRRAGAVRRRGTAAERGRLQRRRSPVRRRRRRTA